jgi:hypothetical protein
MHGIGEQHGFIIAERVEQVFISRAESLLLRRIKFARQHLGLAIFQVEPRQQLDQGRAGVADAAIALDPFPHPDPEKACPREGWGCRLFGQDHAQNQTEQAQVARGRTRSGAAPHASSDAQASFIISSAARPIMA